MNEKKRGRSFGFKTDESIRLKIRTSQILNRLLSLAEGEIEMSAQSLKACEILLRKTLPDLQAVTIGGDEAAGPITLNVRWNDGRSS